jgi:hypothetical protein
LSAFIRRINWRISVLIDGRPGVHQAIAAARTAENQRDARRSPFPALPGSARLTRKAQKWWRRIQKSRSEFTHAGPWLFAFEDGQLPAKGGDLQCKVVAGQKKGPKVSDH